jgi:putative methionine-R-sulfoxide reductase with GAF domain
MRWLVEVSGLGKAESQKVCVEAESWQKALQAARSQRGDEGPMSGFSIELLEEGYRAVDPMARVRFIVKRAPDDMPVSELARADKTADNPTNGAAPKPVSSADPTDKIVPAAATSSAGAKVPRPPGSAPAPVNQTQAQTPEAKRRAETMTFGPKMVGGDDEAANRDAPASPASPAVGSAVAGLPAVKLLSQRAQEPNDASPLTYREYAFWLPPGTTEEAAESVLRAQLRFVEASIAGARTGKLVNLAAFDVEFTGKPPRPPVATLAWKDWKGDPVVAFPRRVAAPAAAAPASVAPASFVPVVASSGPGSVPPPGASGPPVAISPGQVATATASQTGSAGVRLRTPAPSFALAEAPSPGMVRTPSGRFIRGRVTGDELITSLFESMHDLHFLRDALDGGQFCLALATEVLPSRAALIHFFDVEKREWVVACTRGKDAQKLLTSRTPESDETLREAARKRRAMVVADAAPRTGAERYERLGGAKSLVVAPIMQAGRALGAIEILNPLDGQPFTDDEANAMTYIAEQFAEYLGSRGIVIDKTRIEAAATAK